MPAFKVYTYDKNCLPKQQHVNDAGIDLRAANDYFIEPGDTVLVKCGIHLEIAPGFVGLIFPRSGLATKHGVSLANSVGVIDSDYRGEIMCAMVSNRMHTINRYDRIAQLVTVPILQSGYEIVDSLLELSTTARGAGGFGSTGNG